MTDSDGAERGGDAPAPPAHASTDRRSVRTVTVATSIFSIGDILYENSFVLMYLAALGVSGDMIIVCLALPCFAKMLLLIPSAHYSNRLGLVRSGVIGHSICLAGLLCLLLAPWMQPFGLEWTLILAGALAQGGGYALYVAAWYPLASMIVADKERGRFFSKFRLSYQVVSIAFVFLAIGTLKANPSIRTFQIFLGLAMAAKIAGTLLYARLPERKESRPEDSGGILDSLLYAIGAPGYMPFCAYVFLLSIATGSCTSLFGLAGRLALGFSEDQVLLIGNMGTVGSLAGLFLGGLMVDRLGTKSVFLLCHFAFGAVLVGFLGRIFAPGAALALFGTLSLFFGAAQAASGIAIATEMLGLMPPKNKPMATALNLVLLNLGITLSGVFSSQTIRLGILSENWTLMGVRMSQYDSLLLVCGAMALVLAVTLGLVPSVVRTIQWQTK